MMLVLSNLAAIASAEPNVEGHVTGRWLFTALTAASYFTV